MQEVLIIIWILSLALMTKICEFLIHSNASQNQAIKSFWVYNQIKAGVRTVFIVIIYKKGAKQLWKCC